MSDAATLLATRIRHFQEVTAKATIAPTVAEIATVLVDEGVAALGGTIGALWILEGEELVLAHWSGPRRKPRHERMPLSADHPVAAAVRTGRPVWVDDRSSYVHAFPSVLERNPERIQAGEIAVACLPLLTNTRAIAGFLCLFDEAREFPVDERVFLMTITRQCAVAIERLQLLASERELRVRAEALAAGMRSLQELAGELSLAVDLPTVARVFLARGRAAVGAYNAGIWVVDGDEATLVGQLNYGAEIASAFARIRFREADFPLARALATGEPVFLAERDRYRSEFSEHESRTRHMNPPGAVEAIAAVPMVADGRVLGAVSFAWSEAHAFDSTERELLVLMARHAGQAVERARLHAAQERTRVAQRLLADAGTVLGGSLDATVTLQRIAEGLVPHAADWCFIDLLAEDGSLDRVAAANADPANAEAARAVRGRYAPLPDASYGSSRAIVHGEPQLVTHVDADITAYLSLDPERRRKIEGLGLVAWAIAPLRVGERAFGSLVLASTTRRFDAFDLELCLELARRTAIAIDNARLYAAEAAARRDAEAANRTKDGFLAILGHELRNPLAPIVTAMQLVAERDPSAFPRERAIVERQVRHLVRLVDDLLDVSRIARGKVELRRAPLALDVAVAQAAEATAPLVAERGHALVVDVPPQLLVDADLDRVRQVIVNLLTNAARYTPRGGRIAVSAARDGDEIRLAVRDTGPGIPDPLMATVFEPFVQGARGVDRAEGGLGLGLAIVKNLVEQHGGRVAARNVPGAGAELAVWLPAAHAAAASDAPATAPRAAAAALRVLVVDDNIDAAEMLGELLRTFGHEPVLAHTAGDALALAGPAPDIAFLDIGLPDLDGYELARRLRAHPALGKTRLVALTGYGQASDRAASHAAGFIDHLVKPVDIAKLRALLAAR